MKHAALILFLATASLFAQGTVPAVPLPAPTMLPNLFVSGGGGYASPGGTFAYTSVSTLALPQQTYLTGAVEYTLVKGQVESCTLGGMTKPMYQLSIITVGVTGLGGGCQSTTGSASLVGSGQGFLYFRWGKLPIGNVLTVLKNTNTGWKVTLGFSWSRD